MKDSTLLLIGAVVILVLLARRAASPPEPLPPASGFTLTIAGLGDEDDSARRLR